MCLLEETQLSCAFNSVSDKCLGLIVKETVCSQCRYKIHDEIRNRPVT